MSVLIATVGGAPDPIVHAIQQSRPALLALVASRAGVGTDKGSVDEIPKILVASNWDGPEPIVETTDRPDELTSIWEACQRLDQRLPRDAKNVVANYTGGSKSMSAALVSYALRAGWALQVQTAKRTDLVKVVANDGARRVAVGHILALDVRRQAEILAQRHDHSGAALLLERLLADHELPAALADAISLEIADHRFEDALDAYDFDTAARLLGDRAAALGKTRGATWNPRLKAFTATLAWLSSSSTAGNPESAKPKLLSDATSLVEFLVGTARRSAERGRFDDAFSRLYRATELLAQAVLRFAYDLRTAELDRARLPPAFADRLTTANDGKLQTGLMQSYELLSALDHPLGRYFADSSSRLKNLLKFRNESWLAHGFRSIAPDLWKAHGGAWIEWLVAAIKAALS